MILLGSNMHWIRRLVLFVFLVLLAWFVLFFNLGCGMGASVGYGDQFMAMEGRGV